MKRRKRKNYLGRTVKYFQEHKGIKFSISFLIKELKIPEDKFTSAFITIVRRALNKQGVALRAYPDAPRRTEYLMAIWKDGAENQEAIQYEIKRHMRTAELAQQRTNQHVEICKNVLGYDPQQLLEGDDYASNSSDSEQRIENDEVR